MGSVKDLEVIDEPSKKETGIGRFHFSNRYSVFDWGEMPDKIKNKGKSLCVMGAYFFEKLEERGIKTHYRGMVDEMGNKRSLTEIQNPPAVMEIDLVRVIKPEFKGKRYDYGVFRELRENNEGNFLIPLEVIYRNGLPRGSSVFRRLESGVMSLEDFGLDQKPKRGQDLEKPIFDVSTKLEEKDRYLKWSRAQKIASLRDSEVNEIKNTLNIVNKTITQEAKKANLRNEDGKIELAFDEERNIMVVDVAGTLDECRFTYNKIHVSKQIAREYYEETDWHQAVTNAQQKAKKRGEKDWKKYCKEKPEKLDNELKKIMSQIYMSSANEITNREFFDSPPLSEVIEKYERYMEE